MSKIKKLSELPPSAPIHFIGMLGAGMLPLACLLSDRGYRISGSDLRLPKRPLPNGIEFWQGHAPERVLPDALCVTSLAVPEDDPERSAAEARRQSVITRPELLGMIVAEYPVSVGVAGSHGKSTVTAMLSELLVGLSPSVLCGAEIGTHGYVRGGSGLLVYEACEYRDAFLSTRPTVAVLLNLELDHTDYFADVTALERSFSRFLSSASLAVYNSDDEHLAALAVGAEDKSVAFGASPTADYRYHIPRVGEVGRLSVTRYGESFGSFEVSIPGSFNLKNALAAITVAAELGVPRDEIAERLRGFAGIPRRLERIGTLDDHPIIYDYAHHPSEIAAGIDAVRAMGEEEITVVFCPHTYTRTASLWRDFVSALSRADRVILLDVYAAREQEISGVNSARLAEAIGRAALYADSAKRAAELVLAQRRGAVILMGAGDLCPVISALKKSIDIRDPMC